MCSASPPRRSSRRSWSTSGRLGNPETKPILGIIVVEDIFLALYLAALQPILSGADSLGAAVLDGGKAFGFLLLLALAARFGTKAHRAS